MAAVGVVSATAKVFNITKAAAHASSFIESGVNKVSLFKAAAHGLTRGAIQSMQGGKFKAGFFSGLASGFDVGTKGHGGFVGRTAIMGIVGGTASSLGGGKFSNGAMSGAFVHMFNAEGRTALKPKHNLAWDTDGNGRLSMKEANNWYRNGNGKAIDVDASKLTVIDLENRDIVFGASDYAAHGQVSLAPNGKIYNSTYNFESHNTTGWGTIFRNEGTIWGSMIAGSGQEFETRFYNKPTVWKW